MKGRGQLVFLPLGVIAILVLLFFVERRPGLFADTSYIGAILALQICMVSLSHFEDVFFPLMMGTFLLAGSSLPLNGTGMSLRWLFLGVGASGGFVIWIKGQRQRYFESFHLMAAFCVISALVSALVSEVPRTALLKVLSLFLLFLYASSGARLALAGREHRFMNGLVLICEVLVYASTVFYFVLGFAVFGNPNALGAIIGVAVAPILLWAAIVAESRGLKQRRFFALTLCGGLLYYANSRASTLAMLVVILVFTIALRHQRLLLQFAFVSVFFLTAMAVVNPSHMDDMVSSFTGRVIFKEEGTYHGLFGSRRSPWAETMSVVKRHPWFGSGFGTSELGNLRPDGGVSSVYTTEGTNREHGNSYLALAEYMGLLGSVPFIILIFMLIRVVSKVYVWMRRTGNPYHYGIPFALVAIAGLVHACFEDWLFAVGSYLCVFFWVAVFLLMDLIPQVAPGEPRIAFRKPVVVTATPVPAAPSMP
jgi:O-antigen ligase